MYSKCSRINRSEHTLTDPCGQVEAPNNQKLQNLPPWKPMHRFCATYFIWCFCHMRGYFWVIHKLRNIEKVRDNNSALHTLKFGTSLNKKQRNAMLIRRLLFYPNLHRTFMLESTDSRLNKCGWDACTYTHTPIPTPTLTRTHTHTQGMVLRFAKNGQTLPFW